MNGPSAEVRHAHLAFLFMLGTFFYVNREKTPLNFIVLGGLAVLVYCTISYPFSLSIKSIFFAYFILVLALHPKLQIPSIDRWGDISYGLYIYAFPVQQTIAYLVPDIRPINMFIVATLVTVSLAILSWRYVEKPALKLKGKMKIGKRYLDLRSSS